MKLDELGVGIITKQNATKDAPIGSEYSNVKKLGLGSGKPKIHNKKATKNSDPNTLMNLGIGESKELKVQKRTNGFTVDMHVDGKHVGQYTHTREDDTVRNFAEVFPEYRNKGFGSMLLLAAIKTAEDLGLEFEEDSASLTPAMSRLYDTLDDEGLIYGGGGAWAISPSGETELEDFLEEGKRIPRKKGQKAGSKKHSDLYTDENPKGTIQGLKFATVKDAEASVNKIKRSGKKHAHKIQAAIAMEQRAKAAGKKSAAAVYRKYINAMKKKTKKMNELRIEKPDPKDTLGIERKFMPQIKSDDYEEFIEYLTNNGVKFKQETIPASELKAMQNQFSDKGILKQLEKNIAQGPNTKAVIASSDDYILDGHHRWLVAVNTGTDLNVYRVNMPAYKLYDLVNQFQKVYYKDLYDEGKPTIGVPLSSGLTVSIFPHRPLRIKKSTPGKLRYDEGVAIRFTPLYEEWSAKYKKSIDCSNPKGFSQRAHCAGRKKKKKNESINEESGKEMFAYFQKMHTHEPDNNTEMKQFILSHDWELRDFTPDMFPSEEEFFDYDDPFNRIIDVDYSHRVDLSQPIIVGPQFADGKYSVIDGNHRAAAAQRMDKTIKGYFPIKQVNEEDSLGNQINFPGFDKKEKPKPKYNPVAKKDKSVLDKIKGFFTGESIKEAYLLQLERGKDDLVLHVKDTKSGERMEVRGKPGYETSYDSNDKLHQLLDIIGKASNISELMNGAVVNVNPKHPDGPRSYSALDDLMKEGAEITMWTNPEYQGSDVDDEYYNKQPAKLIDVNKLTPFEPADKMDDEISAANMNKLVKAIQAGEKINPIVVVPHKGKLLIIDGHHRYFATIKAGVDKIRAVMADPKDLTWRDDVPDETATLSQEDVLQLKGTNKFTKSSKPGKHFSPHPARGMLVGIKTNEAPTARDSMNLDADKLQQSIDYFYTDHAPKNFGSARTEGNFKGLKVVTFTKGSDTLMFLVNNDDQAVFYVMYSKFDDGVAIGNVRSNGTVKATEVYAYLVDKFGTLYSDDSQTPQGRKIWSSLAKFYPNLDVKDTGGRLVATQKTQVDEGVNDPHIFKAVFLAGGPGSGKSFVARNILGGTGLRSINSDEVYEFLMKKQGLSLDPDTIFSPQGQEIRDKAKGISRKRERTYLDGRLGLIIDGTGKDVSKYEVMAQKLRAIGYDVSMIYVNTSLEVAQQRNKQRERSLEPAKVEKMWNEVQQNLMQFQQIFGAGRFHIIDNSGGLEDLDRQKNFDKVYNETQRFLNTPPSKPKAKQWIQQQKEQNDEKRSATQRTNNQSNGGT